MSDTLAAPAPSQSTIAPTPTLPRAPLSWQCGNERCKLQFPDKYKFGGMCAAPRFPDVAAGPGGGNALVPPAAPAAAAALVTPFTPLMPQTPQELLPPLGATILGNLDKPAQEDDAGSEGQGTERKHQPRGADPASMGRRRRTGECAR